MSYFTSVLMAAAGFILPALAAGFILRHWLPSWWSRRWIRLALGALPGLGLTSLGLMVATSDPAVDQDQSPLALLALMSFLAQGAVLFVLPVSALLMRRGRQSRSSTAAPDHVTNPKRRLFLQGIAAALPITAAGTSLAGVASTAETARVHLKPMTLPHLPPKMRGLRILHLTDLHLGGFMTLERLAAILAQAKPQKPHLIAITGDIADDLSLLGKALDMVAELEPELGTFVTLGNHEYGNGVAKVRRILAGAPVRLLFNEGIDLNWRGEGFYLAGVDDSAGGLFRRQHTPYLSASVKEALVQADPNRFSILLSHRPEAFDTAAPLGVNLTLAGHTHGGQLGLAGKSALVLTGRFKYPWGIYEQGTSRLHTSAGAGQWVPFRLGCPAEAPILQLLS